MSAPTQPPPLGHVTSWHASPWTTSAAEPMAVFCGAEKVGVGWSAKEAAKIVTAHNRAMEQALAQSLGALEARG